MTMVATISLRILTRQHRMSRDNLHAHSKHDVGRRPQPNRFGLNLLGSLGELCDAPQPRRGVNTPRAAADLGVWSGWI